MRATASHGPRHPRATASTGPCDDTDKLASKEPLILFLLLPAPERSTGDWIRISEEYGESGQKENPPEGGLEFLDDDLLKIAQESDLTRAKFPTR
jgi:hypothetical protein